MIDLMEGSGKVISANGILLTTLEGKPFYISCIYNSEERKSLCLAEAKEAGWTALGESGVYGHYYFLLDDGETVVCYDMDVDEVYALGSLECFKEMLDNVSDVSGQ